MTKLTFPLNRIEGHARVEIEIRGDEVLSAHFQATELRGFDYLVQGAPAEQMPVIVPRICGVCSTAHHVAAVKALEDIYDVTPPPQALRIRELLLLGQLLQNQATSLFIFTMPDREGVESIFGLANSLDEDVRASTATRALMVRKAGTDLIGLAGGQFIHPIKAVVGGVTGGIAPDGAAKMRAQLREVLPVACALFDAYWESSVAMSERIGTWGDDEPAHYISSVGGTLPNYCGDVIRVLPPEGQDGACAIFPARNFRAYLNYETTDYSYAVQTSYQGHVMRANSLARVNIVEAMGTPCADEYLARFRETFGRPAHAILFFDLARGIELVYAIERAIQILEEPLDRGEFAVSYMPRDGEGYGMVEAPRGPLIHRYVIEGGLVRDVEFIIPTVHNMLAIERALRVAARRYIQNGRVDLELERAVGRVVRAFDPCIACAAH